MLQRYQQTKQLIINKNLKKILIHDKLRRDLIIWFLDLMRQTLKSKQRKQIYCFLHHMVNVSIRTFTKINEIDRS